MDDQRERSTQLFLAVHAMRRGCLSNAARFQLQRATNIPRVAPLETAVPSSTPSPPRRVPSPTPSSSPQTTDESTAQPAKPIAPVIPTSRHAVTKAPPVLPSAPTRRYGTSLAARATHLGLRLLPPTASDHSKHPHHANAALCRLAHNEATFLHDFAGAWDDGRVMVMKRLIYQHCEAFFDPNMPQALLSFVALGGLDLFCRMLCSHPSCILTPASDIVRRANRVVNDMAPRPPRAGAYPGLNSVLKGEPQRPSAAVPLTLQALRRPHDPSAAPGSGGSDHQHDTWDGVIEDACFDGSSDDNSSEAPEGGASHNQAATTPPPVTLPSYPTFSMPAAAHDVQNGLTVLNTIIRVVTEAIVCSTHIGWYLFDWRRGALVRSLLRLARIVTLRDGALILLEHILSVVGPALHLESSPEAVTLLEDAVAGLVHALGDLRRTPNILKIIEQIRQHRERQAQAAEAAPSSGRTTDVSKDRQLQRLHELLEEQTETLHKTIPRSLQVRLMHHELLLAATCRVVSLTVVAGIMSEGNSSATMLNDDGSSMGAPRRVEPFPQCLSRIEALDDVVADNVDYLLSVPSLVQGVMRLLRKKDEKTAVRIFRGNRTVTLIGDENGNLESPSLFDNIVETPAAAADGTRTTTVRLGNGTQVMITTGPAPAAGAPTAQAAQALVPLSNTPQAQPRSVEGPAAGGVAAGQQPPPSFPMRDIDGNDDDEDDWDDDYDEDDGEEDEEDEDVFPPPGNGGGNGEIDLRAMLEMALSGMAGGGGNGQGANTNGAGAGGGGAMDMAEIFRQLQASLQNTNNTARPTATGAGQPANGQGVPNPADAAQNLMQAAQGVGNDMPDSNAIDSIDFSWYTGQPASQSRWRFGNLVLRGTAMLDTVAAPSPPSDEPVRTAQGDPERQHNLHGPTQIVLASADMQRDAKAGRSDLFDWKLAAAAARTQHTSGSSPNDNNDSQLPPALLFSTSLARCDCAFVDLFAHYEGIEPAAYACRRDAFIQTLEDFEFASQLTTMSESNPPAAGSHAARTYTRKLKMDHQNIIGCQSELYFVVNSLMMTRSYSQAHEQLTDAHLLSMMHKMLGYVFFTEKASNAIYYGNSTGGGGGTGSPSPARNNAPSSDDEDSPSEASPKNGRGATGAEEAASASLNILFENSRGRPALPPGASSADRSQLRRLKTAEPSLFVSDATTKYKPEAAADYPWSPTPAPSEELISRGNEEEASANAGALAPMGSDSDDEPRPEGLDDSDEDEEGHRHDPDTLRKLESVRVLHEYWNCQDRGEITRLLTDDRAAGYLADIITKLSQRVTCASEDPCVETTLLHALEAFVRSAAFIPISTPHSCTQPVQGLLRPLLHHIIRDRTWNARHDRTKTDQPSVTATNNPSAANGNNGSDTVANTAAGTDSGHENPSGGGPQTLTVATSLYPAKRLDAAMAVLGELVKFHPLNMAVLAAYLPLHASESTTVDAHTHASATEAARLQKWEPQQHPAHLHCTLPPAQEEGRYARRHDDTFGALLRRRMVQYASDCNLFLRLLSISFTPKIAFPHNYIRKTFPGIGNLTTDPHAHGAGYGQPYKDALTGITNMDERLHEPAWVLLSRMYFVRQVSRVFTANLISGIVKFSTPVDANNRVSDSSACTDPLELLERTRCLFSTAICDWAPPCGPAQKASSLSPAQWVAEYVSWLAVHAPTSYDIASEHLLNAAFGAFADDAAAPATAYAPSSRDGSRPLSMLKTTDDAEVFIRDVGAEADGAEASASGGSKQAIRYAATVAARFLDPLWAGMCLTHTGDTQSHSQFEFHRSEPSAESSVTSGSYFLPASYFLPKPHRCLYPVIFAEEYAFMQLLPTAARLAPLMQHRAQHAPTAADSIRKNDFVSFAFPGSTPIGVPAAFVDCDTAATLHNVFPYCVNHSTWMPDHCGGIESVLLQDPAEIIFALMMSAGVNPDSMENTEKLCVISSSIALFLRAHAVDPANGIENILIRLKQLEHAATLRQRLLEDPQALKEPSALPVEVGGGSHNSNFLAHILTLRGSLSSEMNQRCRLEVSNDHSEAFTNATEADGTSPMPHVAEAVNPPSITQFGNTQNSSHAADFSTTHQNGDFFVKMFRIFSVWIAHYCAAQRYIETIFVCSHVPFAEWKVIALDIFRRLPYYFESTQDKILRFA